MSYRASSTLRRTYAHNRRRRVRDRSAAQIDLALFDRGLSRRGEFLNLSDLAGVLIKDARVEEGLSDGPDRHGDKISQPQRADEADGGQLQLSAEESAVPGGAAALKLSLTGAEIVFVHHHKGRAGNKCQKRILDLGIGITGADQRQ